VGLITIKEYGERHGVPHPLMRQRCERGCFRTAKKVGRDWVVDEDEEFIDQRFSANKTPEKKVKKLRSDSRYPLSWDDEFREYYPQLDVCEDCKNFVRPKWLDIRIQGAVLLKKPYSEWRGDLSKVLHETMCQMCADRNMELFDKMYE